MDKLLGDIEGAKNYTADILVLIKDCFTKHIEQLIIIFGRLYAAGLKVNAPKYSVGFKVDSLPSLFYNKGGYKTQPKEITRDHGSQATNHYYRSASAYTYGSVI